MKSYRLQSFNLAYNSVNHILLGHKLIISQRLYYLKHSINIKIAVPVYNFGIRNVPQGILLICYKCFSLQINIFSFALSAYADGAGLKPRGVK